ncbi:MAG: flagellar motor protein [Armatimonadota bacterium]
MELGTVIGIAIALLGVLGGFLMEGGNLHSLYEPSALVIVVGGSFGATCIGFSMKHATSIPLVLKNAFFTKHTDPLIMLRMIVSLAKKARQSGILALEGEMKSVENPFVRNALQMVIDGTQPELVREVLETELDAMNIRHKAGVDFFTAWGGFLPTLGVLGTVMGLIHMMENLDDPSGMGPAIAVAFIATLYGVGFANVFMLPLASKLKLHSHEEIKTYEMVIEGILSLQAGDNPHMVSTKMRAYLSPKAKLQLALEE